MTKLNILAACTIVTLAAATAVRAEVSDATLQSLGAPDRIETRAGTLEFKDGGPRHARLPPRAQRV